MTTLIGHRDKYQKITDTIGTAGLYICAFFSLLSVAGSNIGLGLMLIAFILSPVSQKNLYRQPLFWLSIFLIVYIFSWVFWTNRQLPELRSIHYEKGTAWSLLTLFFLTGWWISRSSKNIAYVLLLPPIGFLIGIISSLDTQTIDKILQGVRFGFHFKKPIIFGFHCSVIILGILLFTPRLLKIKNFSSFFRRTILISIIVLSIILLLQGLITSKSRGVWLATLLVYPPTLYLFYKQIFTQKLSRVRLLVGALIVLILSSLIVGTNWKPIQSRLKHDTIDLYTTLTQGLDNAQLNSSTLRLHMWKFGLTKWLEQPVTGWGPGNTQHMVGKETGNGLVHRTGTPWEHLHNAYIELLFQLGLIGLLLFSCIVLLLIRGVYQANRIGVIPRDLVFFIISNFALIAIYSITDFRHLQWNWQFYWLLLSGISFSYILTNANKQQL